MEIDKKHAFTADDEDKGKRLDSFVTEKSENISRSYAQKLIEEMLVTVNGRIEKSNYKLKAGDIVEVKYLKPQLLEVKPQDIPIDVLYEDDYLIVVDKPKGMVVHPAAGNYENTLVNALMSKCQGCLSDINGVIRPGIVHRIDKDTSGVLVVAKTNETHEKLSAMLAKHDIKRVYNAVVKGVINVDSGKIDAPIGRHPVDRIKMSVNVKGRRAVTYFNVLERFRNASLVELTLETGRTHQIRVHMSYIGHPVIGDEVYCGKSGNYGIQGQALHAKLLGFVHPVTQKYMEFVSPLPQYFVELINFMRNESL